MATWRHSGTVCDKDGNPIVGATCSILLYDFDTKEVVGMGESNPVDGSWSIDCKSQKVLGVFFLEGTYGGDTDIAGAEFISTGSLIDSFKSPLFISFLPTCEHIITVLLDSFNDIDAIQSNISISLEVTLT